MEQLSFSDSDKEEVTNNNSEKEVTKNNHRYKVVINKGGDREFKYFIDKEEAEDFCISKRKKIEDKNTRVGVVYKEPQSLPEYKSPYKGSKIWCPFCSTHRKFSSEKQIKKCEYCGVSKNNYYIKRENNLWGNK